MTRLFDKVQTAKHLKEREDLINLKDDWIIDTLMPSSQAGILVAPFKSFKSSLAMHMALMVSQGLPFFGYDIPGLVNPVLSLRLWYTTNGATILAAGTSTCLIKILIDWFYILFSFLFNKE